MASGFPVIVLAAGASSRMGTPKPLLDFDGLTCLELVVGAARRYGAAEVIVVVGEGPDLLAKGLRDPGGIRLVSNDRPSAGQTGSVKAGVRALQAGVQGFFVHPADHPLVEAADFAELAAALAAQSWERGGGKSIAVPVNRGRRGHPLLLGGGHREGILALGDDEPLSAYVRALGPEVEEVVVRSSGVVTGINTPDEYRAALALHRGRRRDARK